MSVYKFTVYSAVYRTIHQTCLPPFSSVMRLFKIYFLEILSTHHILKFLRFFILLFYLKLGLVEIQTFVFQTKTFSSVNYLVDNFYENLDVPNSNF